MHISITLNGKNIELEAGKALDQLMAEHRVGGPVAVAINGEFVPKSRYPHTAIQPGDSIEIVAPMQGG